LAVPFGHWHGRDDQPTLPAYRRVALQAGLVPKSTTAASQGNSFFTCMTNSCFEIRPIVRSGSPDSKSPSIAGNRFSSEWFRGCKTYVVFNIQTYFSSFKRAKLHSVIDIELTGVTITTMRDPMPAYDIRYLDQGGNLTYKCSAICNDDQRAKVLAHAMKLPECRRLEIRNGASLVYQRPQNLT
jgi:hypothetical protein